MIQKTVYFRDQADLDLFNAIDNKAEWLHEHLIGGLVTYTQVGKSVSIHIPKYPEPTTEPFEPSP